MPNHRLSHSAGSSRPSRSARNLAASTAGRFRHRCSSRLACKRQARQRPEFSHRTAVPSDHQSLTALDTVKNLTAMVPQIPDRHLIHTFNVLRVRHDSDSTPTNWTRALRRRMPGYAPDESAARGLLICAPTATRTRDRSPGDSGNRPLPLRSNQADGRSGKGARPDPRSGTHRDQGGDRNGIHLVGLSRDEDRHVQPLRWHKIQHFKTS